MSSSSSRSSGSEGPAAVDEKKRKRMESNRESARRSRQRKQRHLGDLVRQAAHLQTQNGEFAGKAEEISRNFGAVETANAVLRAEQERLARRLELLESVLEIAKLVKPSDGVVDRGVNGRFPEVSSNGGSCEFGGGGFSDSGESCDQYGMVEPWRQMRMPDPAAFISMAVMAATSGGMSEF